MSMDIINLLEPYVPAQALDYCCQLWYDQNFRFTVKRKRVTKLGDYRYNPETKEHSITVNADLNTYSFLLTYIHEVAHLVTFKKYGRKVSPHGIEWKTEFKKLMLPLLNPTIFPDDLLRHIASYLKNPKASSCNDHNLSRTLSEYDEKDNTFLSDIPIGQTFTLGNKHFKKGSLRRTRYLCQDVHSKKQYLISKSATITII